MNITNAVVSDSYCEEADPYQDIHDTSNLIIAKSRALNNLVHIIKGSVRLCKVHSSTTSQLSHY